MNFLNAFPDEKTLLALHKEKDILKVNGHIHTPYSFSAFRDIDQIFEMAGDEALAVLGINDFFVTDGYTPFLTEALKKGIFPLFNIEFISLLKKEQQLNIRVNDPNNPGRCYFSGKGLDYPFTLPISWKQKLDKIVYESQVQVQSMIEKANDWFRKVGIEVVLDYKTIKEKFAKELVRERHIAKAIRLAIFELYSSDVQRAEAFSTIFNSKPLKAALADSAGLENEIRGNLLKAGGMAFVEEDESAFMSLEDVMSIIIAAGGIPCYPVLLDDKNGNYTEFEKDSALLCKELANKNIGCLELIPGRNQADHLEKFVTYFHKQGFVVLMGTEHNAPDMIPLTCDTRGGFDLSNTMQQIAWEGACVVAAHQYCRAKGNVGYLNPSGMPMPDRKAYLADLGSAVIYHFIQNHKN